MALLMANNGHWQKHWLAKIGLFAGTYLAFWKFFNLPGRARRNVGHHYGLKDSLFDQFIDPRRQYSCGYFHTTSDTLADALWEMQPDISVTGISLSENQHPYATQKRQQDQRQ